MPSPTAQLPDLFVCLALADLDAAGAARELLGQEAQGLPARLAALDVVGGTEAYLRRWYGEVRAVGRVECRWCRGDRGGRTIWVAEEPASPLDRIWRELRHYN